ncbi:unnamed protein product, partial [Polarella glacialis]
GDPLARSEMTEDMELATKLCHAAAMGDLHRLQALLAASPMADLADYDGRTALHVAAARGHVEATKMLLKAQANPLRKDNFGLTALDEATRSAHQEVAELIAENVKARPAQRQSTAQRQKSLLRASAQEHWAVEASELQLGNCISTTVKSAVYLASWRGTKVVVKMVKDDRLTMKLNASAGKPPTAIHDTAPHEPGAPEVTREDSEADNEEWELAKDELLHEIRTLSTIRHPDLVLFLGACLDSTPCFFMVEYMEGGDLEMYMHGQAKKIGRLYEAPLQKVLKWASSVARALAFLHGCRQSVIHRDLKPMNLLLTKTLDMKVTDFGLSKIINRQLGKSAGKAGAPKMTGGVGTWRYMAPEVVRHEEYTDRIDIFSFGLIIYFMCTGRQPFYEYCGQDPEQVLLAYLRGEEPRPPLPDSVATKSLRRLMNDCWHVLPAQRPSAEECTDRLAAMSAEKSEGCRAM